MTSQPHSSQQNFSHDDIAEWLQATAKKSVTWDREQVALAFANPVEFPPFEQALVPGDTIAIPVGLQVPSPAELLQGVVAELVGYGVEPDHIRIVFASESVRLKEHAEHLLASAGIAASHILNHDPANEKELEFLGADRNADGVYVNRAILDADVVVPIVAMRPDRDLASFGPHGIAPWYFDQNTQQRVRSLAIDQTEEGMQERAAYGTWAGQLSGVAMLLGVAAGNTIESTRLICGDPKSVGWNLQKNRSTKAADESSSSGLDWAVAHLGGRAYEQSWDETLLTIAQLSSHLKDDGKLVICSSLSKRPGGAFRLLAGLEDEEQAEQKLLKSDLPHALSALLLLQAKRRVHVYFHGPVAREQLESIGIGCVEHVEDIQRLIRHSSNGVFVDNAQYVEFDLIRDPSAS